MGIKWHNVWSYGGDDLSCYLNNFRSVGEARGEKSRRGEGRVESGAWRVDDQVGDATCGQEVG